MGITAVSISMALRESTWLKPVDHDPDYDCVYRAFSEFQVGSGSSRGTKSISVLVVDNLTETVRNVVTLRGIEIKVNRQDLLNDTKMAESAEFVDYLYIAVPDVSDMIEAADSVRRPDWGVMAVNPAGKIRVVREPSRLYPEFREKTLTNVVIKLESLVW